MKANELMIGDWVICNYYSDKPFYMQFGVGDFQKLGFEFCEPIPLTIEILEKNGFIVESRENHGHNLQYCILTDGLWIDVSGENFFEGKLEYVHQLQHALRLCEIKKEIEL